ncbi:Uncharacterised protein [Mycobacteroides abscessus subsp. massiliense]|nr:Uncharacterised protein [Mycobacteroides abscessus subsp. massiliense]
MFHDQLAAYECGDLKNVQFLVGPGRAQRRDAHRAILAAGSDQYPPPPRYQRSCRVKVPGSGDKGGPLQNGAIGPHLHRQAPQRIDIAFYLEALDVSGCDQYLIDPARPAAPDIDFRREQKLAALVLLCDPLGQR